jgi:hypothetical protein
VVWPGIESGDGRREGGGAVCVIDMPNAVGNQFNKTIRAVIQPAEVGAGLFPFAAFTTLVEHELGQSLTGFVGVTEINQIDNNVDNGMQVVLIEGAIVTPTDFPAFGDIIAKERFYYSETFANRFKTVKDQFNSPYQLRFGESYTLFVFFQVTLTLPAFLYLTAYGYQNVERKRIVELR